MTAATTVCLKMRKQIKAKASAFISIMTGGCVVSLLFSFSNRCQADALTSLAQKQKNPKHHQKSPSPQKELDLSKIKPFKAPTYVTRETVEKFIPTNMAPTSNENRNGGNVGNQIMNRGLQSMLNGQLFETPQIVKSAQKIQEAMKTDMNFGNAKSGIQHRLGFQYDAFQSKALLNYQGFLNTDIIYSAGNQNLEVQIKETLAIDTTLSLNHTTIDQKSMMNVMWNW